MQLDSYTRDSSHLIETLQDFTLPTGVILVTLDMEALYTNITHETVDFLDLKIGQEQGKLQTTLFRKDTATNSLLHYSSFHPQHLKRGIPTGQFARIKRNCSTEEEFNQQARSLSERFKVRGYPRKIISKSFQKIKQQPREQLLQKKERPKNDTLSYITTYNNQWGQLRRILARNWNILINDDAMAKHIPRQPRLIARRARSLRDRLSHSHFTRPTTSLNRGEKQTGTYPCGDCSVCQFMLSKRSFENPENNREIYLKDFVNCRTRNVVYGLMCNCPKMYVGQTSQELRKRTQQHLSNISLAERDHRQGKTLTSVASHFLQEHRGKTDGIKIVGLAKAFNNIRGGDMTNKLLQMESRWIYLLNSKTPGGLNEDLLFTGFYKK